MDVISNDPWRLRSISPGYAPPPDAWPVLASPSLAVVPIATETVFEARMTRLLNPMQPTFLVGGTTLLSRSLHLASMEWDMRHATMSVAYMDEASGGEVHHTQRVLLSLPQFLHHTITVTGISDSTTLRHELIAPLEDPHESVSFSRVLLRDDLAAVESVSESSVALTIYLPSAGTRLSMPRLFEPSRSGKARSAWVDLDLLLGSEDLRQVTLLTMFSPKSRSKFMRRVMTSLTQDSAIDIFVDRHNELWDSRWRSHVDVPSADMRLRVALVSAAYNLHACSPGGLDLAASSFNIGTADAHVIPAQILLMPEFARQWLSSRSDDDTSDDLARLRGFRGRLFAYGPLEHGQICCGASHRPQTGVESAASIPRIARIYGTIMSGLNAWNYFRVSSDRGWLVEKGYPLIESCADFISSIVGATGRIEDSASLFDPSGSAPAPVDETLCIASASALLRVAVEACYLVGRKVPRSWTTARFALEIPTETSTDGLILLRTRDDSLRVAPEIPLASLCEPIGSLIEAEHNINISSCIRGNSMIWSKAASDMETSGARWGDETQSAHRRLIQLHAHARAMQVDPMMAASFEGHLATFLDLHCDFELGFGNLATIPLSPNDLGLSAHFLLMFMHGLCGVVVSGGIGERGNMYAPLGLCLRNACVAPPSWEQVILRGVGSDRIDSIMMNRTLFSSRSGIISSSPDIVPWSTDFIVT